MYWLWYILITCMVKCSVSVSFDTVMSSIEQSLSYFENGGPCAPSNCTSHIAIAAGELIYAQRTDQYIPSKINDSINTYIERIYKILQDNLAGVEDNGTIAVSTPTNWISSGDYMFRLGAVVTLPLPPQTNEMILTESEPNDLDGKCMDELFENGLSTYLRICRISPQCYSMMHNPILIENPFDDPVSTDAKLIYISSERLLNCTNSPLLEISALSQSYCSLLYTQMQNIIRNSYSSFIRYYYLDKMLLCGTYGYAEFLANEFVLYALSLQSQDGFFGTADDDEDTVQNLTAEGLGVMCNYLRYLLTF